MRNKSLENQQKLFDNVQGYNIEVHGVTKYTIISQAFCVTQQAETVSGYHHLGRCDSHLVKGIMKSKYG